MSAQTKPRYTLEEYFELERKSEERFEYWNGEVFGMSGVSEEHAEIETNLIVSLKSKLRDRYCPSTRSRMWTRITGSCDPSKA